MWDHEDGNGAEALAVSEDKLLIRSMMQEEARKMKEIIQKCEGCGEDLWDSDLTNYGEDDITIGYEDGLPNVWRWEIQKAKTV